MGVGPEIWEETNERWEFKRRYPNEGMHFKDLRNFPVQRREGRNSAGAHFSLSGNTTIDAHISEIAPGSHNNEHRHMNEAIIYIIQGRGYTLLESPDGEKVRIDWQEGDLLSPPMNWWHQHFNLDPDRPARYLAVTNVPLMAAVRAFKKERRK